MKCFLGIDGGGSKTAFLLIDEAGNVLSSHTEGPAYYLEVGFEPMKEMLARGIAATLKPVGIWPSSVDFSFIGLPAYGEDSALLRALDLAATPTLQPERYKCGNDSVCGWAGALAAQDGINVICGTGSMAYGEFKGQTARSGGWGELFSDEGSGYWIALQGLNLFSRMADGRAPRGALYGIVREYFGITPDLDLCAKIFGKSQRSALAALSALVVEAASSGDPLAAEVFTRAAEELQGMIQAVYTQLNVPEQRTMPVSYSGGMFSQSDLLLSSLRTKLATPAGRFRLITPRLSPPAGAALYAAKVSGSPLSPKAIAALESKLKDPA